MAEYRSTLVSSVNAAGCRRALLKSISSLHMAVLLDKHYQIVCRECNDRGDWKKDLVAIEIVMDPISSEKTRIEVKACSDKPGDAAHAYVRHLAQGLLRSAESSIHPQKCYA